MTFETVRDKLVGLTIGSCNCNKQATHDYTQHEERCVYRVASEALRELDVIAFGPIDMVLHCPKCGLQHVDAPEPSILAYDAACYGGDWPGRWTNPPHRSHLCAGCGHIWRPADVATNGVAAVKTKGKADSPIRAPAQAPEPTSQVRDFHTLVNGLTNLARAWESAYLNLGQTYESLTHEKSAVEEAERYIVSLYEAAIAHRAPAQALGREPKRFALLWKEITSRWYAVSKAKTDSKLAAFDEGVRFAEAHHFGDKLENRPEAAYETQPDGSIIAVDPAALAHRATAHAPEDSGSSDRAAVDDPVAADGDAERVEFYRVFDEATKLTGHKPTAFDVWLMARGVMGTDGRSLTTQAPAEPAPQRIGCTRCDGRGYFDGGSECGRCNGHGFESAAPTPVEPATFQERVQPWMLACFGAEISSDTSERNHRFLEESLELVQACGCTAHEAHQLVDYVYGRPAGERSQEVGGVAVTLAALCLAQGLDMHAAGETELARIWTKVDVIRAKQAVKPKHSPLPVEPGNPANQADMRAICEALGFDPTNHHNAAKCPYCRPADPAGAQGGEGSADADRAKGSGQ